MPASLVPQQQEPTTKFSPQPLYSLTPQPVPFGHGIPRGIAYPKNTLALSGCPEQLVSGGLSFLCVEAGQVNWARVRIERFGDVEVGPFAPSSPGPFQQVSSPFEQGE